MNDNQGNEIRERFRTAPLPSAPVRLRDHLAAVASTLPAASTSRLGRARLVFALAAAVAVASIGLIVGGGTDTPSPTPDGIWGPLAVANLMEAPAARTEGTLELTDRCAFLVDMEGVRQIVVWPRDRTTWNPEIRTITLRRLLTTETIELREGDPIEFGGGGSSVAEGGQSGEQWASGFDWVAPPAPDCLTDVRWVLSDAAPLTAAATPQVSAEPHQLEIVCREGEPPAYTCADVIDAVLAAVGPDRPIEQLEVGRLCRTRNPCEPVATVIVAVTFAPPDERLVRLIVNPGPDGPVAYFIEPEPGETIPPYDGPTPEPLEQWFNVEYGTVPPSGRGAPIHDVRLSNDRRTLTVEFIGGGGYSGGPCSATDYEPWVGREGNDLLVGIYGVERPTRTFPPTPSGIPFACTLIGYGHTYHLRLPEPFAGELVRDVRDGETYEVGSN